MFYGNKDILLLLKLSLENPINTYLFKGTKGVGKYTIALYLARRLLCHNNLKSCSCDSCIKVKSGNHPDLHIIVPDGNSIKVDQIRKLNETTPMKPMLGQRKIYLIDNANLMTVESQNALLKTIEEPNSFNIFILISHNNLLNTIESRSSIYEFKALSNNEISDFLSNFNLQQFQIELITAACQGSVGVAKTLIEEKYFLSMENIIHRLFDFNNLNRLEILNLFKLLKEKDKESFYDSNKDILIEFLYIFYTFFMDCIKVCMDDCKNLVFLSRKKDYVNIKDVFNIKYLHSIMQLIEEAIRKYADNRFNKNDFFKLITDISVKSEEEGIWQID
ncbi:MAG: DNA polymerase III subunit [Clostridia bacterium]|nr:DNA polymerase III subunit [Clostridia bacterium]